MTPVDLAEKIASRPGHAHLMGIGGIGMAGLAWLLKERGWTVSGCDLQENRQTEWLRRHGIQSGFGHGPQHVQGAVDWLIRSTAVPQDHPEVQAARSAGIPVSRRGEVLPALMRDRTCIAVCGTHGKTTTTSMIAQILGCGYCVGGEIVGFEGVARDGDVMVVEADESDGTLAGYAPDISIITNIEYDHMEHHASEAAFINCFEQLIEKTKRAVHYRADDPIARRICSGNAKCRPFHFPMEKISIPLPGRHNQWNAAAAAEACRAWKSEREIFDALGTIHPVRRRFETVFEGGGIRIVSDYAHHPTEIAALVQTARESRPQRLLGVFQPHRHTRTKALGPDFPPSFEGLDQLWLVPVYAASEAPIEGGTTLDLAALFPDHWRGRLHCSPDLRSAWSAIRSTLQSGDLLLVIGAGDIEQLAEWARRMA